MESSIRLFRVRGVEIGINWSWLLIFALIAWSLGSAFFPATYPGLSSAAYLGMALAASLLFFGSVLLHELAHALVGVREGARIEGITLWLLGGVARFSGTPRSPGGEFRMTIVGPLTSLVLGGLFLGVAVLGDRVGLPTAARGVAEYMGGINLLLAAFNLVPALPLDGGRVLRSWLWKRQESFVAATVSAARAGRAFGWALIGIGLLGLVTGQGIGGLWFALLGWFLLQAAQAEAALAVMQGTFRGRHVGDIMTPDPETIDAGTEVERFIDLASGPRGHSNYPVVEGGRFVGAVSLRRAGALEPREREIAAVRDVMTPVPELKTVGTDVPVVEALQGLQEKGRAFVVEDGRVVGLLSAADVARALEAGRARGDVERPKRGAGILVWVVVAAIMLSVAGYLYRPPLVVITPAPAIDITDDVTIRGVPTHPVDTRYIVTPVSVSRPNGLTALLAAFDAGRDLVPAESVFPSDVPPGEVVERQSDVFVESRMVAAAAAARQAGLEVSVGGSGARVVHILDGSPAEGVLRQGDVIVSLEGRPVATADQLRQPLSSSPPGSSFRMEVERGDRRVPARVRTGRVREDGQSFVGVGVLLETRGLSIDLPFEVSFRERAVGGPSAGLAYALVIADLLGPEEVSGGGDVAATGTVDLEGDVGPVGGLTAKVESAEAAGAEVLLVPANAVGFLNVEDVNVRGVGSLGEASRVLGLT